MARAGNVARECPSFVKDSSSFSDAFPSFHETQVYAELERNISTFTNTRDRLGCCEASNAAPTNTSERDFHIEKASQLSVDAKRKSYLPQWNETFRLSLFQIIAQCGCWDEAVESRSARKYFSCSQKKEKRNQKKLNHEKGERKTEGNNNKFLIRSRTWVEIKVTQSGYTLSKWIGDSVNKL